MGPSLQRSVRFGGCLIGKGPSCPVSRVNRHTREEILQYSSIHLPYSSKLIVVQAGILNTYICKFANVDQIISLQVYLTTKYCVVYKVKNIKSSNILSLHHWIVELYDRVSCHILQIEDLAILYSYRTYC